MILLLLSFFAVAIAAPIFLFYAIVRYLLSLCGIGTRPRTFPSNIREI